jgi:predicted dehydrogenase
MSYSGSNRRDFFRSTAALAAGAVLPEWLLERPAAADVKSPNARLRVGAIGVGGRGSGIARDAQAYGDILAVCDGDRARAEGAKSDPRIGAGKAEIYEDYRKLLDRGDIDVVTIGTPDHWHTRICIDALRAGKDVYCEKPLTLTIEEGKRLCKVVHETGRVLQVGTQQRSEHGSRFLTAVAMVREGRIGRVKRVTCAIGSAHAGGPFPKAAPPEGLNWDMWLGQTPKVDYIKERCHYEFRWWYEYSGGKLTDWGAHHVDIAQWAIGMERSGPKWVEPVSGAHPVAFKDGYPLADDRYNTATEFTVRCAFPNGVEMVIRHDT